MAYINRQTWCRRAAAFALWRRVCPCSCVSLVLANANLWPYRCSLVRPGVVGARRWDRGMGKTNDAGRRYERQSRAPHNRHRRIRSVSLLPQSSLPCPNAPLSRPHLGVQYVVGHLSCWSRSLSSCIAELSCARSATSSKNLVRPIGSIVPRFEGIFEQGTYVQQNVVGDA
jgi:hypothetical protein